MTVRNTFPEAHVERVRRYLAALLPPEAAGSALHEALDNARYWRDHELEDLLAHAHTSLRARLDVPARTEAAVLVAEAGVNATTAGDIAGLPAEEAAEAAATYADGAPGTVEATPDGAVDAVEALRSEPVASPTAEPIGGQTGDAAPERPPGGQRSDPPPEVIGETLRRRLRREDLDGHRYPRGVRLALVGTAIAVFLVFLAAVALNGLAT